MRISIPLQRDGTAVIYPGDAAQWFGATVIADHVVGDYRGDLYEADGVTKAFDWSEPPAPAPPQYGTRITPLAFLDRFETEEEAAIRTAAKESVAVESMLARVQLATYIDLADPRTRAGIEQLEAAGLLAEGRASEILDTAATWVELPMDIQKTFAAP